MQGASAVSDSDPAPGQLEDEAGGGAEGGDVDQLEGDVVGAGHGEGGFVN